MRTLMSEKNLDWKMHVAVPLAFFWGNEMENGLQILVVFNMRRV